MSFLNKEECYDPISQTASPEDKWRDSEDTDASSSSTLKACEPISDECDEIFVSQRPRRRSLNQRWPWICSTLLLGCSTMFLYIQSSLNSGKDVKHEGKLYDTDLSMDQYFSFKLETIALISAQELSAKMSNGSKFASTEH
jgi:hypothetical protein